MDNIWTIIITEFVAFLFTGGGLFALYTWRAKKRSANADASSHESSAKKAEADLTEQILEKYQKNVLATMNVWEQQSAERARERAQQRENDNREIIERLEAVSQRTSDIAEFLNGDFAEFQTRKRNERGQFISVKTLGKKNEE